MINFLILMDGVKSLSLTKLRHPLASGAHHTPFLLLMTDQKEQSRDARAGRQNAGPC